MKKFTAYLIFPFLFGKTGIILSIPVALIIGGYESWEQVWFMVAFPYCLLFNLIVGHSGLLEWVLDGMIRFLKIDYHRKKTARDYGQDLYGGTVWSYPTISINGKDHEFTLAEMGGNKYPPEARLKRKIITAYLFRQ